MFCLKLNKCNVHPLMLLIAVVMEVRKKFQVKSSLNKIMAGKGLFSICVYMYSVVTSMPSLSGHLLLKL